MLHKFLQIVLNTKGWMILLIPISVLTAACSTNEMQSYDTLTISNTAKNSSLSFYVEEDGDDVYYQAEFNGGKIDNLYRNGVRIEKDKIDRYRELIEDRLSELDSDVAWSTKTEKWHKNDLSELKKSMKKLRSDVKHKIKIHIDKDLLKKEMDCMKDELASLKNFRIYIDPDIKLDMKRLKDDLRDIHIETNDFDFDFDFDPGEIEIDMRKMEKELDKVKNIKIDLSGLDESMANLKIEMKGLDKKMGELKIELKKLNSFIDALKKELLKDGYITNVDEEFEVDFSSDKMEINDEPMRTEHIDKYKKLYEKYMGKVLKDDTHFKRVCKTFCVNGDL